MVEEERCNPPETSRADVTQQLEVGRDARQVAMYFYKSLTHASLPENWRSFGGKRHSTVNHSIKKVQELRKKNHDFDQ